ncbi:MAG: putative capsular polysaccharide synthesis family protein [bacterium]
MSFFKKIARYKTGFYHLDRIKFIVSLWLSHNKKKPIILIYALGKTGTTSLLRSMQIYACEKYNVYHTHFLPPDENTKDVKDKSLSYYHRNKYHYVLDFIWKPHFINKMIRKNNFVYIITGGRDPLKRRISSYFQTLHLEKNGNVYRCTDRGSEDFIEVTLENIHPLIEAFYNSRAVQDEDLWFDKEINKVAGYNLLKENEFDYNKGYKSFRVNKNIHLIFYRLENIQQFVNEYLIKELELPEIRIVKSNMAENKEYNKLYKAFISSFKPSKLYIDEVYSSDYAKFFYTLEERKALMQNWLRE